MSDNQPDDTPDGTQPPGDRRTALPWQSPKDALEDRDAPDKVQALLESPSYRPADQDKEFLDRDDVRFVRLGLDYLKPELSMAERNIAHTIVVFGSTRIREPAAALRMVAACEARLAEAPENEANRRALGRAKRVAENSRYYDEARRLGQTVGREVEGANQLVIMTGGGPGIMEAANRGAHDAAGQSVGLNISLPHEQYPNPYITPDLCFQFHYFGMRKLHFMHRAKALVAFPGGYGTIDEIFDALTLIQTRKMRPIPVVLVGKSFWSRAIDFEFLVEEGVIDPEDAELFWYAETAEEIWHGIAGWYAANGGVFGQSEGATM